MKYDELLKNDIDETVKKYMMDIKPFKSLNKQEEKELLYKYKHNNDIISRNKLVNSNLKYACKLANHYRGRGVAFSELISEANNALIYAIDKFDEKQNVKIISYAKWWINQRLDKLVTTKRLLNEDELPVENDKIDIEENVNYEQEFNTENDNLNNAFVEYEELNTINENNVIIKNLYSVLNDRERDFISMKFGIEPYEKESTLEEIGDKYSITRERVRQVLEKAFLKMRTQAMLNEHNIFLSK